MNSFRGFVVKEFKQIFRDQRTLMVLFGMPVIMLMLFGFAIRNEITNVKIGILDLSKDQATRTLIHKIDASSSFQIKAYLSNYGEIEGLFRQGEVKEVMVFEAGFEENLMNQNSAKIQLITDATDPNLANMVQAYTTSIVRTYEKEANRGKPGLKIGIQPAVKMMYNPELKSVNLFVPGLIAVILMLVSALMTSLSITREKEMGNLEILLISPLKPYHIIIGKVLPYLVLSVGNVVIIVLLARFIFHVPFVGSHLLFFMESILYILTALALGVFISSVANNQQTALMVALAGLLLPTVLLSGFIFPVTSMPVPLQIFSNIIPAKWFLVIVRSIMLKGSGLSLIWKETLVLVGMASLLIALSLKNFKVRLQ